MAKAINFPSTTGGGSVGFAHKNPTTDVTISLPNETCDMPMMRLSTAKASTSGTFIDFTDVPSWAKKITVMFNGVSTNSTSPIIIRVGSGGTPQTSGYNGFNSIVVAGSVGGAGFIDCFGVGVSTGNMGAGNLLGGSFILSNFNSNIYVMNGSASSGSGQYLTAGNVTLSGVLNIIRITTSNGTDTFDAGSINVLYEGY